jgi:hypothetical protein
MALPVIRPLDEGTIYARTTSIGATPVAASTCATTKGYLQRAFAVSEGASTGTISVAVSINGGSTVGTISFTGGSNAIGSAEFGIASSTLWVNEGDLVTFTPSGGGGATIPGHFYAIIREA